MENVDLLTRINQHYNSFSKGQKLLANYIIDNYDRAAFITASKMGRTVGVSESTVVRFAYALGYDGYPALQRSLQEMIRNRLTTVQRIQLTSDLSQDEVLSTVLKSDISNIRSTIESVNTATFNTVIDHMLKARKIYVVGIKSAAPLAQFLGYYLNFRLDDVCIVNSTVYETMLRISDKDMCIGISFPRYSSKAVEALSFRKEQGRICDGNNGQHVFPYSRACGQRTGSAQRYGFLCRFSGCPLEPYQCPYSGCGPSQEGRGVREIGSAGRHMEEPQGVYSVQYRR